MRQATHYNEKIHEMDSQIRANKDELKKKDAQILEMTNEVVKVNNDSGKKMALVEQERDFLRRDLHQLRESMAKREGEVAETVKLVREKEEAIKSLRAKKKLLKKEVEELRVAMQTINSQQSNQSEGVILQNQRLTKELENVRIDRGVLQSQLESTVVQRDENKRMCEALLAAINQNA